MKNTIVICLTIIICFGIVCYTYLNSSTQNTLTEKDILSEGELEGLEYLREHAANVDMTVGEYIERVKDYEAEKMYFLKVSEGTNTPADDRRAILNGWISGDNQ